jgi:transposase-like protein
MRLLAGGSISSLAEELSVAPATLHRRKKQALIDNDQLPGVRSVEADELAQARRTSREIEAELELVKTASALFNGEDPVSPKRKFQVLKH